MSLTIEGMQEHVEKLGTELGCIIEQAPGEDGMMYVEEEPPRIVGPTLDGSGLAKPTPDRLLNRYGYPNIETRYLVLLHELGHVAHGHTQGRPPYEDKTYYFDNGVLNSEAEAWEWALDNCLLRTLQLVTVKFIHDRCIGSYHAHALAAGLDTPGRRLFNGNRDYVKFAYGSDKTTVAVKKRMLGFCKEA